MMISIWKFPVLGSNEHHQVARGLHWAAVIAVMIFLAPLIGEASTGKTLGHVDISFRHQAALGGNAVVRFWNRCSIDFGQIESDAGMMKLAFGGSFVQNANQDDRINRAIWHQRLLNFAQNQRNIRQRVLEKNRAWENHASEIAYRTQPLAPIPQLTGRAALPRGLECCCSAHNEWFKCGRFSDIPKSKGNKVGGHAGLACIDVEWSGLGFVVQDQPRASFCLHFVQLAPHDVQLAPENTSSDNANSYQGRSEQTDTARPSRHNNIGFACLFFMAAAAAVFVAFKSAEDADDRGSPWWWLPFYCSLGFAIWLAAHAIGFTL